MKGFNLGMNSFSPFALSTATLAPPAAVTAANPIAATEVRNQMSGWCNFQKKVFEIITI